MLLSVQVKSQKVGLVLSGGGAKGVAHIGVIRALEEAEIPIDYISGTSMGAIIGGLYSAGYTTAEMESLINSSEFKAWSTGKINPKYIYFYKKQDDNASWADFKFTIDSTIKPSIPTNLVSPFAMDFAFMEIFASASAASGYNFNNLMVPFRCVASDISKAKAVVLEEGDLGSAIRASMTFPFYFKPIMIDSVLLFDGGMYNNFSSDIMYSHFYPDIIIGSQASSNATMPKSDDIMSQLQNMLMMKTDFDVICDNSILIKPNLLNVNVIDFSHTAAFIDSGYAQTMRMIPEIRKFVTERRTKAQLDSIRSEFNNRKPELKIGAIQINGLKKGQFQYMNQLLHHEYYGKRKSNVNDGKLTLNSIKPQYFRFISEGKIANIYPRLIYDRADNLFDLTLDIERQNQLSAEIGGAITSSSVNELFLQLNYYLWTSKAYQLTVNSYFGRFYNSALAEMRIEIPKSNPYLLTAGFVFNKFNYFKTSSFFYSDEDPFFMIEQENFSYLTASFPVKNDSKVVMDMSFGTHRDRYYQTNNYSKNDILDLTKFTFVAPGISYEINSLNRKEYASNGVLLRVESRLITGTEKYIPGTTASDYRKLSESHTWISARFTYENYFSSRGKAHFGLYSQLYFSTQDYFTNYTASILSASVFNPVPESRIRFMPAYRANKFAAIGSKNVYTLFNNMDFRLEGYLLVIQDAIKNETITAKAVSNKNVIAKPMASSALVYNTPIGPFSISVNYFSGEIKPFSFFLKFGYLLFNRKPY